MELKQALQLLALPATAQARLNLGDSCRVAGMEKAFRSAYQGILSQPDLTLAGDQQLLLELMAEHLASLRERPLEDCTDTDLRVDARWRRVRLTARATLATFDWALDIPPSAAFIAAGSGEEGSIPRISA